MSREYNIQNTLILRINHDIKISTVLPKKQNTLSEDLSQGMIIL